MVGVGRHPLARYKKYTPLLWAGHEGCVDSERSLSAESRPRKPAWLVRVAVLVELAAVRCWRWLARHLDRFPLRLGWLCLDMTSIPFRPWCIQKLKLGLRLPELEIMSLSCET